MIKFQITKQICGFIFETAMACYSKDEEFNRPLVVTLIVPKRLESVQNFVDALHGNETSNGELEFWTKSGETCFLLINATMHKDSENDIIGVVRVLQDVT